VSRGRALLDRVLRPVNAPTGVLLWMAFLLPGGCGADTPVPPAATAAQRIVGLAPHIAEIVYAAGAGDKVVGVSAYTDFPPETARLPVVGDAFGLDLELLALLQPDLILAWREGTPSNVIEGLREAGFRVASLPGLTLDEVAQAIEVVGRLTGTEPAANRSASEFRERVRQHSIGAEGKRKLRVFYQIDERPLYTVGGQHFISEIIMLCGGENIFADLNLVAAQVAVESVIERDPQVILAADDRQITHLEHWRDWPELAAVRANALFGITPALVARPGPRLVDAAAEICDVLETARGNTEGAG